MANHAQPSASRRRNASLALVAAGVGASFIGLAAASAGPAAAKAPACTIDFSSSNDSPTVNQNITLTWSSTGADQLVASWTTASVPDSGSQVTTKGAAGPASYQVTGLKNGQYCGGAAVNVVFLAAGAATPSSAPSTSAVATPTTSTPPPPTTSAAPSTSAVAAPSSTAVAYPAQSPTSGTPVPWWEQPLDLVVVGVLSLFGSLALFNRERVRAVLVRRH